MKVIDGKVIVEDSDMMEVYQGCEHRIPHYFVDDVKLVRVCSYKEFKEKYEGKEHLTSNGCKIKYCGIRI